METPEGSSPEGRVARVVDVAEGVVETLLSGAVGGFLGWTLGKGVAR